jgi:hypothetical protein
MFRNLKHLGRWLAIAMAVGLFCSSQALAKKPDKPPGGGGGGDKTAPYTLVELSSMDGSANAINQLDGVVEVVGVVYDYSGEDVGDRAHYWMVDPAGNVLSLDLQTLPPSEPEAIVGSQALDVNNDGIVVGSQWDDSGVRIALLWPDAASEPIELPLPEGTFGGASSINDEGIVLGLAYDPDDLDNAMRLVVWKVAVVDGVAVVLDTKTILSKARSYTVQVVNSGYVCATVDVSADPGGYQFRAFRLMLDWDDDEVWEVPGSRTQLFDDGSLACGINEAGTVCGRCTSPDGSSGIAFVMTVSGDLLDLPVLPAVKRKGFSYAETHNQYAWSLTNSTPVRIVGQGARAFTQGAFQDSELVPLRWDGETSVTDLRTVTEGSPDLYSVGDINDAGWITARTKGDGGMPALPVVLIPNQ